MTHLTPSQIELLRGAAGADDGAAPALDDTKMVRALIKRGLLIALPQTEGPSRMLITQAGRAVVAAPEPPTDAPVGSDALTGAEVKPEPASEPDLQTTDAELQAQQPAAPAAIPKGKLGFVISMLKRPEGAAIGELTSATGWQAHSVRGAIAGAIKKKLGFAVRSEKTVAGRVYRISDEVQA